MTSELLAAEGNDAARALLALAHSQDMHPAVAIAGLTLALGVLLGQVSDDEAHLEQGCAATAAQVRDTAGRVFAGGQSEGGA